MSHVRPVDVNSLKVGSYIVIDNEPCKIVELTTSKPGKHGSAKARIVAIGIFDNVKRSIVVPTSSKVNVPEIRKTTAQVIAILPESVQLMDLNTYETYEVPLPDDESLRSKLEPGVEVEVWEIMGRRKIMRTK